MGEALWLNWLETPRQEGILSALFARPSLSTVSPPGEGHGPEGQKLCRLRPRLLSPCGSSGLDSAAQFLNVDSLGAVSGSSPAPHLRLLIVASFKCQVRRVSWNRLAALFRVCRPIHASFESKVEDLPGCSSRVLRLFSIRRCRHAVKAPASHSPLATVAAGTSRSGGTPRAPWTSRSVRLGRTQIGPEGPLRAFDVDPLFHPRARRRRVVTIEASSGGRSIAGRSLAGLTGRPTSSTCLASPTLASARPGRRPSLARLYDTYLFGGGLACLLDSHGDATRANTLPVRFRTQTEPCTRLSLFHHGALAGSLVC